jgi:hypothetical protein
MQTIEVDRSDTYKTTSASVKFFAPDGTWRVQFTVRDCQTGAVQRTFPALYIDGCGRLTTCFCDQASHSIKRDSGEPWVEVSHSSRA